MNGYIAVGIIVWVIIEGIIAYFMNQAAEEKGYNSEAHAFALCFWLGIVGWLYVVALPDKNIRKQNEEIINLLQNNIKTEGTHVQSNSYDDLPSL